MKSVPHPKSTVAAMPRGWAIAGLALAAWGVVLILTGLIASLSRALPLW